MKLVGQRICGVLLLLVSLVIILVAVFSECPEDKDVTAVLVFIPMGFWLLMSRKDLSKWEEGF